MFVPWRRLPSRSIQARLTLTLGAVAVLVFAVVGGALYLALASELERADRAELASKVEVVRHFIDEAKAGGDVATLRHHIDDVLIGQEHLGVWLLSDKAEVTFGRGPVPKVTRRGDHVLMLAREDGAPMEGLQVPIDGAQPLSLASMIVAVDVRPRLELLRKHRRNIVAICALGVVLSSVLAGWAARRGLKPVQRLSREAAKISPSSLSLRLRSEGVDAEVEDLVRGFNAALDRVEAAYRKMEAFNADAAHELRTPLSSLINAAQVTLAAPRSADDLREALGGQLEDLDHLKELINDMLFLARADEGELAPEREIVSLAAEAKTALDYYEAALDEAGLIVAIEGNATVRCNARLLRRALSNLLSNAIKHTPRGERVVVRLRDEHAQVAVEVYSPGPAIPAEIQARMFDRFFRADEARSRSGASHGLGLAIVKAVATMHGGLVFVRTESGGNSVGLKIPVT
jgi:two-component system heavy metal sensor histidine kinase CusS